MASRATSACATRGRFFEPLGGGLKIDQRSDVGVEDERGSLGPIGQRLVSHPAHQTGRADFRHPAFRLASPQGTRRDAPGQALEAQNAEFSMSYIECKSTIAAPLHLVPSREEPAHSLKVVLVDATVCVAPRAIAKVVSVRASSAAPCARFSGANNVGWPTRLDQVEAAEPTGGDPVALAFWVSVFQPTNSDQARA
jgi:hypothetical protein